MSSPPESIERTKWIRSTSSDQDHTDENNDIHRISEICIGPFPLSRDIIDLESVVDDGSAHCDKYQSSEEFHRENIRYSSKICFFG